MDVITKWIIDNILQAKWLTGHRTQALAAMLFLLGGLKLSGHLPALLADGKTYDSIVAMLTAATGVAASVHKPT